MSGIGHNGGPSLEPGAGFRRVAWRKARAALLPALPLEVVRYRVARAERLGIPYKTYATIRATTGRDIIAFLYSGNALGLKAAELHLAKNVCTRLEALEGQAIRLAAIYPPSQPDGVKALNPTAIDLAGQAPDFLTNEAGTRRHLKGLLALGKLPADAVILVDATAIERSWCALAGMGGRIDAALVFDRAAVD